MENKDLPIYPQSNEWINDLEKHINKPDKYGLPPFVGIGLTKREHIATQILSGLLANYLRENTSGWDIKTYVIEAIELTDTLLKELDKQP